MESNSNNLSKRRRNWFNVAKSKNNVENRRASFFKRVKHKNNSNQTINTRNNKSGIINVEAWLRSQGFRANGQQFLVINIGPSNSKM